MDERTRGQPHAIEWNGPAVPRARAERTRPPLDASHVSLLSEREMRYWTDTFRATIYQLRDAIRETDSREPAVIAEFLQARAQQAGGH